MLVSTCRVMIPSFILQRGNAQPIAQPECVFLQNLRTKSENILTCSVDLKMPALAQTVCRSGLRVCNIFFSHINV